MSHPDLTRLVHKLARRYAWCGAPLEDLVAEGFLGVQIATDRFDPERGVKFITYAHHWIRGKVQRACDKHIKANTNTSSMDIQDDNGRSRSETIADTGPSADDQLAGAGHTEAVQLLLASFSPREALVISRRFKLVSVVPCPRRAAIRKTEADALSAMRKL
jgi:RNA polymerase sigma factor (sigma-70 family)